MGFCNINRWLVDIDWLNSTYMRNMVVKFTWILIVAVDTGRRFAWLVNFLLYVWHVGVVERISSPLVFWRSKMVLVDDPVVTNNHAFTHSTSERRAIGLRNHLTMLANDCALIVVFQISPVDYSILLLRVRLRDGAHNCWRCTIDRVTSAVCNIYCSVIVARDHYRVVFILLKVVVELNFLMNSLFGGVVQGSLLGAQWFFVSLWWLRLEWSERMSGKIAYSLDIMLNFGCNLVISNKCSTNRSFIVSLFILTLAFPLILVMTDANRTVLLISCRVIMLNVLKVLILIHGHKRLNISIRYLLSVQISPRVPCSFWSTIIGVRVAWSGSNVRPHEFHGTSTTLSIHEILHERVAPLLTTTGLSNRCLMNTVFM